MPAEIKRAKKNGDYQRLARQAAELERLDLPAALERVFAFSEDRLLYDALAARWIIMAANEGLLNLSTIGWASQRFIEHLDPLRDCTVSLRRAARGGGARVGGRDAEHDDARKHMGLVDEALTERDLEKGLSNAVYVPSLSLDRALELTLLAFDLRDDRFEPCARKLLIAVVRDIQPEVLQVKKLADCFVHLDHVVYGPFARASLEDVVGQLRRIGERRNGSKLIVDFDGPELPF